VKSQTTEFGKFGKLPKKTVHKLVLDWYFGLHLYVWAELTTHKLGGSYSQQALVLFSVQNLCGVLHSLNRSTQLSE
jgi:hypothetical protein